MTATVPAPTTVGRTTFTWGERTFVMGILNVTPDSFSGDGLIKGADPLRAAVDQAGGRVVGADIAHGKIRDEFFRFAARVPSGDRKSVV